jgi:hypothetical protein
LSWLMNWLTLVYKLTSFSDGMCIPNQEIRWLEGEMVQTDRTVKLSLGIMNPKKWGDYADHKAFKFSI